MEMARQSAAQAASASAVAAPVRRRRPPTQRFKRIDGRTKHAKRIAALIAAYTSQVDPAVAEAPAMQTAIARAAELTAVAEQLRARALRGEADIGDLVRCEGAANRALALLKLNPTNAVKKGPTLAEYLAQKAAEQPRGRDRGARRGRAIKRISKAPDGLGEADDEEGE